MPESSLREIEKHLTSLWMDSGFRERVFAGTINQQMKPADGEKLDKRGASLYARLINIGHVDVMSSIYPYCSQLLGRQWESVVRDYISLFPPDHYRLNKTARRFPQYVLEKQSLMKKYPFLSELADYEWVEMELLEDERKIDIVDKKDLTEPDQFVLNGPIINAVHVLRSYHYPVSTIAELIDAGKGFRRKFKPDPCFVLIYRHPRTHRCRFVELDDKTFKILQLAENNHASYADILRLAVELSEGADPQLTVTEILDLIEDFHESFVFVGSKLLSPENR